MADADLSAETCWFCRNGRHAECARTVPVTKKSHGSHDCSFDSANVPCACACP